MGTLPEISLGTAALVIFACCAFYVLIRGIMRTFVNTACLALSAWVGFQVWQQAPALAIELTGKTSQLITTGLPVIAFFAALLVLRKILGFFRAPVPKTAEDAAPKSPGQLVFRLIATIIPAGLICLVVAILINHVGSVAEIRDSAEFGMAAPPAPGLAEKLKSSVSAAIPESLMGWLDPLTSGPRVQLAKMIASSPDKALEPMIDPATGRPYPRAVIVDDPELKNLAEEGRFSTLLRHPLLSEALKDPSVRKALGL